MTDKMINPKDAADIVRMECGAWTGLAETIIRRFKKLSTVDAVQVVRCKDCKHWKTAEGVSLSKKVKFCTYHIRHKYARHDEDFCSRGERKDGGDG